MNRTRGGLWKVSFVPRYQDGARLCRHFENGQIVRIGQFCSKGHRGNELIPGPVG